MELRRYERPNQVRGQLMLGDSMGLRRFLAALEQEPNYELVL